MTDDYAGPDAKVTLIRVEGKAEEKATTYVILFCLFKPRYITGWSRPGLWKTSRHALVGQNRK